MACELDNYFREIRNFLNCDSRSWRKDFTKSEAVALGKRLEELERPKADVRRRATQGNKQSGEEKFTSPDKGKTCDKVGKAVGMSGVTYTRAKAVVKAAEDDLETFEPVHRLVVIEPSIAIR